MKLPLIPILLEQLFSKPATNPFIAKHLPPSVTGFLAKVAEGKATVSPPVPVGKGYKGLIGYEKEKCTGCGMCAKVCPAHAIEIRKEEKRITIFAGQCIQCEQCVEVCPFGCLWMTENFLTATTDRYADAMIIE